MAVVVTIVVVVPSLCEGVGAMAWAGGLRQVARFAPLGAYAGPLCDITKRRWLVLDSWLCNILLEDDTQSR